MSLRNDRPTDDEPAIREVRLEDGGLIIYDTENEDAWLQADEPTPVG
ncbi:DUF7331 family protein [Natronomonas marina]|jgi:hypothetical protein|nr:hypothetical protein [Natronomonas marina]